MNKKDICIYFDVSIQFERIKDLLFTSIKHDLLTNIIVTNDINKCDLIILLVNSCHSLINLHKQDKSKEKFKKENKENSILQTIYSSQYDGIKRQEYFKLGKPIILIERLDSSVTWIREFDEYPNVIGIIKNRICSNMKINNEELFSGRYHIKLVNDNLPKEQQQSVDPLFKYGNDIAYDYYKNKCKLKLLPKEYFNKFHSILWDFHSSPISDLKNKFYKNHKPNLKEKNIDVFCVHSIRGGVIGFHRQKAIDEVNSIKNIKAFTQKCDKKTYRNNFVKSKICIACWGYGEWTHMDGYAMYSKTILIKPNSNFVKMDPDLYVPGKRYIPCKPDFSDLKDIIIDILKNYNKYHAMLEDNRKFIMSLNKVDCCKRFWNKIRDIYESN